MIYSRNIFHSSWRRLSKSLKYSYSSSTNPAENVAACPFSVAKIPITAENALPQEQASTKPTGSKVTPEFDYANAKPFSEVPGPKGSIPFIGTTWRYTPIGTYDLEQFHLSNLDKFKKFGTIVKEEIQWKKPLVHIFDPNDMQTVLRNQGKHPVRPLSEFVKKYRLDRPKEYNSIGLVNSDGKEWHDIRSAINPLLLEVNKVASYLQRQSAVCDDFISYIRSKRNSQNIVENILDDLYLLALESVAMVSLDTRLGCLNSDGHLTEDAKIMVTAANNMFQAYQELYYGLPLWKLYETKGYKKLGHAEETSRQVVTKYIKEATERMRTNPKEVGTGSVLEELLRKDLHPKDLRVLLLDTMIAGIDTVSNTLSLVLYNLSKNPECQDKMYQEILNALPENGIVTKEVLEKIPYTRAVLKESFRISSVIPHLIRILNKDIVLQGYNIPAGVPIWCHSWVASQLSENFENPEKFVPERWMDKTKNKIHPYISLPFGIGARMCVGRRFAEQEIYCALLKIIRNYKLEFTGELKLWYRFILVPKTAMPFRLTDRQK